MIWSNSELTRWLLRPDTKLGPEAAGATDIAKADLLAKNTPIAKLRPLFLVGLITSFCFLVACILTLVQPPAPVAEMIVPLAVPYILVHVLTAAPLALERLPYHPGIPGLLVLVALLATTVWYLLDIAALLWIAVAIMNACALLYFAAYVLALADPAFRDRAETVHTLQKSVAPSELNRRLGDIHSMQSHLGTFRALLRQAEDQGEALRTTLGKFRVETEAGRTEARRQLTAIASRFRDTP